MDIKIINGLSFYASRKGQYTDEQLLKVMPIYIENKTPINEITKDTGCTAPRIISFSKKHFGISLAKLKRNEQYERYRTPLSQCLEKNKSIQEMASIINKSYAWTRLCLMRLGLYVSRSDINKEIEKTLDSFIKAGYTLGKMSEMYNVSERKLNDMIQRKYGMNIVELRHKYKIKINRI